MKENKSKKGVFLALARGPAPAGAGGGAGEYPQTHLHALYGAEKGRGLLSGGGVPEPAQRLYRPLLFGTGGLHAAGCIHLRHLHRACGRPGDGLLPLWRFCGEVLPAGALRRRNGGPHPGRNGGAHSGGTSGGLLRVAHRTSGAAAQERLSGHRYAGLCRDHPRRVPVG